MAFKMKRSIIKGTPIHKASVVKAKSESIVRPYSSHAGDVLSGIDTYAKSFVPKAIDYGLKMPKIEIDKKEKIKEETPVVDEATEERGVEEVITPIEPRGYKQPKTKRKEELALATQPAPDSGKSTDRFEEAAEKFGYDISTVKGYKKAEKAMEYNDRTDEWINPKATVEGVKKETHKSEEDKKIEAEVAAITAEAAKKEQERQAKVKVDKIAADKAKQEKIAKGKAKRDEINLKNEAIRERNAARKYFKGKTNQPKSIDDKVAAWREINAAQQAALNSDQVEIPEQDDPDWWETQTPPSSSTEQEPSEQELDKIAYKPQVMSDIDDTLSSIGIGKQRRLDKKYASSGPSVRANMLADGYQPKEQRESTSAAQKRDDRIFRNAKPGGTVQSSLRKSGYIPRNEI